MGARTRPRAWGRSPTSCSPTCKTLEAKTRTLTYQPDELANGANGLLDEVADVEDHAARRTATRTPTCRDFEANVDGAQTTFGLLAPALRQGRRRWRATIAARFDAVQQELATLKQGGAFPSYDTVDDAERKQLSSSSRAGKPWRDLGRSAADRRGGMLAHGARAGRSRHRERRRGRDSAPVPAGGARRTTPSLAGASADRGAAADAAASRRRYARLEHTLEGDAQRVPAVAAGERGGARRGGGARRSGSAATTRRTRWRSTGARADAGERRVRRRSRPYALTADARQSRADASPRDLVSVLRPRSIAAGRRAGGRPRARRARPAARGDVTISRATVVTDAAIIVFREGLEAVLILAAITAASSAPAARLRRAGAAGRARRASARPR